MSEKICSGKSGHDETQKERARTFNSEEEAMEAIWANKVMQQ
ncbi:MAG: hypothetical protein U5N58_04430 [Actinomycetota bacterium]|nr:hypothetical protein [Actinomycetota bacterium]